VNATHIWAAEDVNKDADRQPDPNKETGEVEHGEENLTQTPVRARCKHQCLLGAVTDT
jgi:hypothetical protein